MNPYSERITIAIKKDSWPALDAFFRTLSADDVGRVDGLFGGKPSVNLARSNGTNVVFLGGSSAVDSTQRVQNTFAMTAAGNNGFRVREWPTSTGPPPDVFYADVQDPLTAPVPIWDDFMDWAGLRIAAPPDSLLSEVEWFEALLAGLSKSEISAAALTRWGQTISTSQTKAEMITATMVRVFPLGVTYRFLLPMSKHDIIEWAEDEHGLDIPSSGPKRRVIFRVLKALYDDSLVVP